MERPLFRTDLVCKAIDSEGQRWVDVTDPDSGSTFRFYEIEYALACALDGTRDAGALAAWAQAELGIEPDAGELRTVLSTLESLGYLTELADVEVAGTADSTAAPPRAAAVVDDADEVELGAPGKSAAYERPAKAPSIPAPVIELGVAGATHDVAASPPVVARPAALTADLELGAPGRSLIPEAPADDASDFATTDDQPTNIGARAVRREPDADPSVDLSQQFKLDALEVKEAVRQSRVMQAVTLPDELADADMTPLPPAQPGLGSDVPDLASSDSDEPRTGAAPIEVEAKPKPKAIVLPEAPAVPAMPAAAAAKAEPVSKPAAAAARMAESTSQPPRQRTSIGNILIMVLVLAVLGGGAAFAYLKFFADKAERPASAPRRPTAAAGKKPSKPAPRPVPLAPASARLGQATAVLVELSATGPGVVEWLAETGGLVEAGAPVVKLAGVDAAEKDLARAQERLKVYQDAFDQAAARNDKVAMKSAEADVKRKQGDIDRASQKLAALVVVAPNPGRPQPMVAVKDRVAAGAPVVTFAPAVGPIATFGKPGRALTKGQPVEVSKKGDPAVKATCEVTEVGDAGATVSCPVGGALVPGDEIVLAPAAP